MPIYEYNCDHCSFKFDKLVLSGNTRVNCPLCQGSVKKLMSTFSVGASHPALDGMPDITGPKMCTNCGPSNTSYNRN